MKSKSAGVHEPVGEQMIWAQPRTSFQRHGPDLHPPCSTCTLSVGAHGGVSTSNTALPFLACLGRSKPEFYYVGTIGYQWGSSTSRITGAGIAGLSAVLQIAVKKLLKASAGNVVAFDRLK